MAGPRASAAGSDPGGRPHQSEQDRSNMFYGRTRSLRVGVTGLARAGKTAFLTSVAANLLAQGAGLAVLPALFTRLGGRGFRATIAPSGAHATPRFDHRAHLASLASDPARWPERTAAVSLLSLDLEIL